MLQKPPCISYLGSTDQSSFPLILVIGREYNGTGSASSRIGQYCFDKSPKSLFWNRAYGVIGRATDDNGLLKSQCRREASSPIIFSNLLPISIRNSSKSKLAARKTVTEVMLRKHLTSVFNQEMVKRAEVVILSCGQDAVFEYGKALVRSHCQKTKKKLIELPYLGSRLCNSEIDGGLSKEQIASIRRVVQRFVHRE